jgi:hypothetical protein
MHPSHDFFFNFSELHLWDYEWQNLQKNKQVNVNTCIDTDIKWHSFFTFLLLHSSRLSLYGLYTSSNAKNLSSARFLFNMKKMVQRCNISMKQMLMYISQNWQLDSLPSASRLLSKFLFWELISRNRMMNAFLVISGRSKSGPDDQCMARAGIYYSFHVLK